MQQHRSLGLLLSAAAFTGIGAGVSAAGTPLLALLAEEVAAPRRARAAALVWICMIAGFVVTTVIASQLLTPFSFDRLTAVVALIGATALGTATLALWRLEPQRAEPRSAATAGGAFADAVREVWRDPSARMFAWFVFCAMLAYSAQDLILEPFAGAVFGFTPADSTRLSSVHQGGMLLGMLSAAALALRFGALRTWAAGGCAASAAAFVLLAAAPSTGSAGFLRGAVLFLGLANGAFAIGAVGSMIALAGSAPRPGLRMGVFGAAQAIAYAIGGFAGAAGSDVARSIIGSPAGGYVSVFAAEAALFAVASALAFRAGAMGSARLVLAESDSGDRLLSVVG
jgi:BCD family chlorophyll transporter-like MFS transporter